MFPEENLRPRVKRTRKRRCDSKYDEKFAKQLKSGIRYKKGYTIVELCHKWRISISTYTRWVEKYPDFAEAHEIGKVDHAAFWHEKHRGITLGEIKGHGGQAQLVMANTELINWSTKAEVVKKEEESFGSITINIIPAPERLAVSKLPDNFIEGQTVPDNVIELNPKDG